MKIKFKNDSENARIDEPVSFGLPLPEGYLSDDSQLVLHCKRHGSIPFGSKTLATWSDNSIKWLLIDVHISVGAGEILTIEAKKEFESSKTESLSFFIKENGNNIEIKSCLLDAVLDTKGYLNPLKKLIYDGRKIFSSETSWMVLNDQAGELWYPFIEKYSLEHDTQVKKVLCFKGNFRNDQQSHFIKFVCRIHFFSKTPFICFEFSILNPKAACHKGGAWDLGDENSFFFKNLSIYFPIESDLIEPENIFYTSELNTRPIINSGLSGITIYQDSSGHKNWYSKNHINREEQIPLSFKGYRVYEDQNIVDQGDHASPLMGIAGKNHVVYACVENFWQNFPKTIEADKNRLKISLFPKQFNDLHELQPGEQKAHRFYLGFGHKINDCELIKFVDNPLIPVVKCEDYYNALVRPRPVPESLLTFNKDIPLYDYILQMFINENSGYQSKNIIIDEFGWRNFGDIYADHESVLSSQKEFISHYNNQYDVIKGAIFQFMRNGNKQWFTLAKQLADHVYDIDIYHTTEDKYQYNYGMFWHTDHHLDAHTSSHRTISGEHRKFKPKGAFGGGPYPEHNYATGFLYLYWITGSPQYKDGVIRLADYIINWLDGPDTLSELTFQTFRDFVKKIKSFKKTDETRIYVFDGPCRASGNSLNTLLDAYMLTKESVYMDHAQDLILKAVHPDDDQNSMNLLNAELRWFYTVFLQALGRYLDIKFSSGQTDNYFHYGRSVLINYAKWMLKEEYPYLDKPEILEFPNETWAAQDLRKSDIFAIASSYACDDYKDKFKEKSHFFFSHGIKELNNFETKIFTRPMALVMSNCMPYMEMDNYPPVEYDLSNYKKSSGFKNFKQKHSLLKRYYLNLLKFSLKKETTWIKYQLKAFF